MMFQRTPYSTAARQTRERLTSPTVAAALAAVALMLARPATIQAQHSMAGMPGHVTIPKGANYTVADVEFMQGMIAHHAQAIYMSRMAEAHGANPASQAREQDRPVPGGGDPHHAGVAPP